MMIVCAASASAALIKAHRLNNGSTTLELCLLAISIAWAVPGRVKRIEGPHTEAVLRLVERTIQEACRQQFSQLYSMDPPGYIW